MPNTLYYCMSNTELRQIVYACGKSSKAKNKAATILRIRKHKTQQQQVSMSGFSFNFHIQEHEFVSLSLKQEITRKNKGNLKEFETQIIGRSLNFSNNSIVSAGSLCLHGRPQHFSYQTFYSKTQMEYKKGTRRNRNTKPRKRIEVLEDALSSRIEQPANLMAILQESINNNGILTTDDHLIQSVETTQNNEYHKIKITEQKNSKYDAENKEQSVNYNNKPLANKDCKGAISCGLNIERAADRKPVSANLKIIARYILMGITGLLCLSTIVTILVNTTPGSIKWIAGLITLLILILFITITYYSIVFCIKICYKLVNNILSVYHQKFNLHSKQKRIFVIDRFGNRIDN